MLGAVAGKMLRGKMTASKRRVVRGWGITSVFSGGRFGRSMMWDADRWASLVRAGYWIIGVGAGAFLTYSTRHFINGDAINYIEMGEALRMGRWSDLANLTASPGYAFLLGLAQILLDTNRGNEIPLLKSVNFVCLICALGACDLLMHTLKPSYVRITDSSGRPLPWPLVQSLAYGMCLFSTLNWVRPRLIAPEMAVFALILLAAALIVKIREDPQPYGTFGLLGVCAGISYLFKTFFFPFSVVFFALAALATRSVRFAVPRVLLAVVVMLAVSSPLLYGLSTKLGRFSFGETGKLNYAKYIAGTGDRTHKPMTLIQTPQVLLYRDNPYVNSTRPASFDPSYWTIGIEPVFDLGSHAKLLVSHLWEIFDDRPVLSLCFVLWCCWLVKWRALRFRKGWFTSVPLILGIIGAAGTGLYSIIHVEMRYVAPFLFLIFLAVVLWQRLDRDDRRQYAKASACAVCLVCLTLGLTASTVADQTMRGLWPSADKPSYAEAYAHMVALTNFFGKQGVTPGADVAVVGMPPYYWSRMAGLRIIAEIPREEEILSASSDLRRQALNSLQEVGVGTVVAWGKAFERLTAEGWQRVPGTGDFFVYMSGQPARANVFPPKETDTPRPEYRTADGTPIETARRE